MQKPNAAYTYRVEGYRYFKITLVIIVSGTLYSSPAFSMSLSQLFRVSHRFIRFDTIKHLDEIPCEG
jgi:hypothetical protein